MTGPRDEGRYEAPLERLAGASSSARRARIAVAAVTVVVGSAVGLAIVSGEPASLRASPPPRGAAVVGSRSPSASGSGRPAPATTRPSSNRSEQLLDVPNRSLDGVPHAVLVERSGLDLQILGWTPGAGLTTVTTIPAAIAEPDSTNVIAVPAPDSRRIMVLSLGSSDDAGDHGRLLTSSGGVLWEGDGLTAVSGALWSDDGRMVVTSGRPRRWHVVTIDKAGVATDRIVHLPSEVYLPMPIPIGSLSLSGAEPRTLPLGFSADGQWIYGGVVSPQLGIMIGEFRVGTGNGQVETVMDLRVGRPDGLVPQPGTLGGRLVDPLTGRIANWHINSDTSGGPPTVEVRGPDAGFLFAVKDATPIGSAWGDDGGLYVLSADALLFPDRTTLTRFGPDGTGGPPILETGPIAGSGLVSIRSGFAAVVSVVNRPKQAAQLLLVDVHDPARATAIALSPDQVASIIAIGLVP
jgi:hypothetical protein